MRKTPALYRDIERLRPAAARPTFRRPAASLAQRRTSLDKALQLAAALEDRGRVRRKRR